MIVHLLALLILVFGLFSSSAFAEEQAGTGAACRPVGSLVRLPGLPEASGLAVSLLIPDRLWTHNDGEPTLFALDTRGAVTARVRLSGAVLDDWEAVAVGPCPTGSCLYVADIGDNNAQRKRITIAGNWREVRRVDLAPLGEPQGEGVALGSNNIVYVAGGGNGQGGTFAALTCAPNR